MKVKLVSTNPAKDYVIIGEVEISNKELIDKGIKKDILLVNWTDFNEKTRGGVPTLFKNYHTLLNKVFNVRQVSFSQSLECIYPIGVSDENLSDEFKKGLIIDKYLENYLDLYSSLVYVLIRNAGCGGIIITAPALGDIDRDSRGDGPHAIRQRDLDGLVFLGVAKRDGGCAVATGCEISAGRRDVVGIVRLGIRINLARIGAPRVVTPARAIGGTLVERKRTRAAGRGALPRVLVGGVVPAT